MAHVALRLDITIVSYLPDNFCKPLSVINW